jgi:SAM-dependent methyltransferase
VLERAARGGLRRQFVAPRLLRLSAPGSSRSQCTASLDEPAFQAAWAERIAWRIPAGLSEAWWAFAEAGIARGEGILALLAPHCDPRGARVLDAGCGFGGATIACTRAGARVHAVDVDLDFLHAAQARATSDHGCGGARFHRASVMDLPFAAGAFDMVICADVLEHVPSQERTVSELARVLRPGGVAYLSFPNRLSPHNLVRDPHYHLPCVSVLPRRLALFCVPALRPAADTYNVWNLPVASRVEARLERHGLEVVARRCGSAGQVRNGRAVADVVRLNTCHQVSLIAVKEGRRPSPRSAMCL